MENMSKTREKLLKTSIRYFGDYPYDKVSIEEITTAAKVNVSAVSYYFGGKEKLYHEVINRLNNNVISKLTQFKPELMLTMSVSEATEYLKDIFNTFYELFISLEGRCRVNIFLREITCSYAEETKNLFNQHVAFSYKLIHEVLTIFYVDKLKLSAKIIPFRIAVFFSVLKDLSVNTQKPTKIKDIYDNNIYINLVDFMFEVNHADA